MQNNEQLIELAYAKMYFGKYKDWYLSDVPEPYFVWFNKKGFPPGKTGGRCWLASNPCFPPKG
jgi:uncharacterized protein (DUF3820 family)